jgi:hypothetical protein
MQRCRIRFSLLLLGLGLAWPVQAQNAGMEFFEKKVRPVFAEHCYECHSAGAKKIRGALRLDSREAILKGGASGAVIEPGAPDKSLLILAVRHADESLKMPRNRKLPATVIADLEAWVKMGAPIPPDRPGVKTAASWEEIVRTRRQWWSLQPVRKPPVPTPRDASWSEQPIDRFLLAALEEKGLAPAASADPHTLLRRLSLVLTGLPPTPPEIEAFLKEYKDAGGVRKSETAVVERLVDRLLASPHFGERWARHWMDIVRFTETHGNEWNYDVHHAWRYRDYLIRAFNGDVPYDQLVREHIAGDLLPRPRWNAKEKFNESVIGTAFYRFGEVNHDDCIDLPSIGYDLADNQIDTLTKAFQAMTVACARCHDHKLDAVSMLDYHGLLGILRSARPAAHTIDSADVNAATTAQMQKTKQSIRRSLADVWLKEIQPAAVEKALSQVKDDKLSMESPLWPWRQAAAKPGAIAAAWKSASEQYAKETAERTRHNQGYVPMDWSGWQIDGQGLRAGPSRPGEFTVPQEGDRVVSSFLPAGFYSHAFSEKLNGVLRSGVLTPEKKYISFHVVGERASAVRLVSNGCQLNYRNYRYLTKSDWHWLTMPVPPEADRLRTYAEVMTKFDNPKFPDQLGTLGGDKRDYRLPWEQAASDPRSYFGVSQVVLHDHPGSPKATLTHLGELFSGAAPATLSELAQRYRDRLESAVRAWRDEKASDDDVRWLDTFTQIGFLSTHSKSSPEFAKLLAEYRRLDGELSLPRVVPGLADHGSGFSQPVFNRGDCMRPGEKAPRRYVSVIASTPFEPAGSGRLELAEVLAAKTNPLTARVMVNRIWHHLFGAGIVRSVDDFGHVGDTPSHPEMLDYLANGFVEHGWSMKQMIRQIVLTRAFQQSHRPTAAALELDPTNRLLSNYPARRMEAEAIRDSLLASSGRLDRTLFGLSIPAYREKEYADRRLFRGPLDGNGRRSIYIKVTLMEAPRFLEVFNFPGGKVCQGKRDVTNVPAQALAMLNDPFVQQQADVWAQRLIQHKADSVSACIDAMFLTALGRSATVAERDRFARFVEQVAGLNNVAADRLLGSAEVWREAAHAMFNLQEFISIP